MSLDEIGPRGSSIGEPSLQPIELLIGADDAFLEVRDFGGPILAQDAALRDGDMITSTHRPHEHAVARGLPVKSLMAELYGKATGCCHGKGGSMHIADPATGNLGANAIVAGSVGIATGAAFSARTLGTGGVAVCFFGEGALGQGLVYEEFNLAQLWKLPVIYVCENNLYNEYTHFSETTAGDILTRGAAFGLLTESVDGQDVRAVYAAASPLVERARSGEGPAFLLCNTYRYHGHHVGDINREYYRSRQEEQEWKSRRDPLKLLSSWITEQKLAAPEVFERIQSEAQVEIRKAVDFAVSASYPRPEEADQDVYA